MSDMTMRMIHQAQNLSAAGVRHVRDSPAAVLATVVKWGQARRSESRAPQAVAKIIDTIADKTTFPHQTRKQTKKALKHAAREPRRQTYSHKRNTKVWLLCGLLATATVVGTFVIIRTLSERFYPEVLEVVESVPPVKDPVETSAQK